MTHKNSPQKNQPITLQQKRALIAAYQQTGNMAQAMREANIHSPRTAYLWWHRFCEGGDDALQPLSHARHTQKRLPDVIVEHICLLRCQEPEWGRRRIADELTKYYGQQVVSPASVEAILRRAGLWEQASNLGSTSRSSDKPDWLSGSVDYECLLEIVKTGIRHSLHSESRTAMHLLYQQVWRPLEANLTLRNQLLLARETGSWLLSSRLHLGHSLMNSGYWSEAVQCLRETIAWMHEQEQNLGIYQRQRDDAVSFVSLRRDDIWLGCYQHLGLTLGKEDVKAGLAYLQTALNGVHRSHKPIVPGDKTMIGDLERDLANLKLKLRHFSTEEVHQHLLQAQKYAEVSGSPGVQAFTYITWARLYDCLAKKANEREKSIRRQQRELMQQALEQAIILMEQEQEDRPMRQTMCFVDAALLAQSHGMSVDKQRLQQAAQYCITYGYGHQAEKLLNMPDIHVWLPEDTLRNLIRLLQKGKTKNIS